MNITEALRSAEARLSAAGTDTPRLDAEVLLAHATGKSRSRLCLDHNDPLDPDIAERFESWVDKRSTGCPVAYMTGVREFWSIPIRVTPDVLIPRPETETVVEEAIKAAREMKGPLKILDLCTGSGCIAAALASEISYAEITLTDISEEALAVARLNLDSAGVRTKFCAGDLFQPIDGEKLGPFDLIASNPPYVATEDMATLPRDVRDFEPEKALAAGPGGLDFIGRILEDAWRHLRPGGWLVMEVGAGQSEATVGIATGLDRYDTIRTTKDLAGIDRVVSVRVNNWSRSN